MNRDRWKATRRLFDEALEIPVHERETWLRAACPEDEELRSRVESLLANGTSEGDEADQDWLEAGAPGDLVAQALSQRDFEEGWIDDFRIEGVLGSGGTASVLRAEQQHPKRTVALKIMRFGILSESARQRFGYESEILGSLRHPGIAQVYSSGTYKDGLSGQDLPYFAMEFIEGARPIDRYVREAGCGLQATLELFLEICDAVNHGHQRGVLHRDLKPGNILVDREGHPKIIDFGIAKAVGADIEHRERTLQGEIVGTLHYMSPEQLQFDQQDLDLRSDVYALGVILHELLTGQRPFDLEEKAVTEVIETIGRGILVKPSLRGSPMAGASRLAELDWVVLTAMDRDRERRYASANELAADVRRFLADEPVLARPPSRAYLLRKFARRHRIAVVAASAVLLALLVGFVLTSLALDEKRLEAETALGLNAFLLDMVSSVNPYEDGREVKVLDLIARATKRANDLDEIRPAFAATLHATLGATLLRLGQLEDARTQLEDAYQLASTTLGPDHRVTLTSLHDLAATCYKLDQTGRARELAEKAYQGRLRTLGPRDPETAKTLALTALLAHKRQDLEEAASRYEQARTILVERVGPDSPEAIQAEAALGTIALSRGKRADALEHLHRAIDLGSQRLGPQHPTVLSAKKALASVSLAEGRTQEAIRLLEEVETSETKVLGPQHGNTLQTLNNLAGALQKAGRTEEAIRRYRQLLERRKQAKVYAHYMTGIVLGNLAICQEKDDQLDASEKSFAECFAVFEAARFPDNHWVLASYRKGLAVLRIKQSRFEEAERLLLSSQKTLRQSKGDHSARIRAVQLALIDVYEHTKRPELARDLRDKLGQR